MTKKNSKLINGKGAGASVPQVVPHIDNLIRERNNIRMIINELDSQIGIKMRFRERLIQSSQSTDFIDDVIKNLRKRKRNHKKEFNRIQRQIFRLQNPTINDEEEYEEDEIRNAENAEEGTGFKKIKLQNGLTMLKLIQKNIIYHTKKL